MYKCGRQRGKNAATRSCLSLPSPSSTSQPGMRPRPFPSRLAMPCARSLPFLAAAPASPRALQSCCSCNLGCQLLGDAPWRRSHLHNWHPECRPAPAWALRTARRSLARVFAACPSAREHTMYSHAKVAQPVGRPWYSLGIVLERPFLCGCVLLHLLSCTAPQSYFHRTALACSLATRACKWCVILVSRVAGKALGHPRCWPATSDQPPDTDTSRRNGYFRYFRYVGYL